MGVKRQADCRDSKEVTRQSKAERYLFCTTLEGLSYPLTRSWYYGQAAVTVLLDKLNVELLRFITNGFEGIKY